jgi:hypothetical protein
MMFIHEVVGSCHIGYFDTSEKQFPHLICLFQVQIRYILIINEVLANTEDLTFIENDNQMHMLNRANNLCKSQSHAELEKVKPLAIKQNQ